MLEADKTWRVELDVTGIVKVGYIGFIPIVTREVLSYDDLSDIPEWMQHRVAALRMMPPNPHESKVEGVGRRVNENVYWILE